MLSKPFANVPQVDKETFERTSSGEELKRDFKDRRRGPIFYRDGSWSVIDMRTPYVIFLFGEFSLESVSTDCTEAAIDVVQKPKLRIPYVAFHHDSGTYRFVQEAYVVKTAEDTVGSFIKHVGDSIRDHTNHTWNRITVYEVR